MQTETFAENLTISSEDSSPWDMYTILLDPSNAAANAKTLVLFMDVVRVDDQTRIWVEYEDSADGVHWNAFAQTLIDTNSIGDATTGVWSGSNSEPFGAWLRLKVSIVQNIATPTATVKATVSFKGVWKPF